MRHWLPIDDRGTNLGSMLASRRDSALGQPTPLSDSDRSLRAKGGFVVGLIPFNELFEALAVPLGGGDWVDRSPGRSVMPLGGIDPVVPSEV